MSYRAGWIIHTIHIMYLFLILSIFRYMLMHRKTYFQTWYINRFLKFREGAFTDPDSYFHNYAKLTKEEAIKTAMTLWKEINWLNLKQNILPTRERASLILTKSANHAVEEVRLRK